MSWRDAVLHIPLGLAFTGIAAATMALPWPLNAFVIGAEMIWLREATQWQEDNDRFPHELTWKFLRGWRETALTAETWVPIAALIVIGLITTG